jgi:hypothetical protein
MRRFLRATPMSLPTFFKAFIAGIGKFIAGLITLPLCKP